MSDNTSFWPSQETADLRLINSAFTPHYAIVDEEFDHFGDEDLIDHDGRFNHLYEVSNAH